MLVLQLDHVLQRAPALPRLPARCFPVHSHQHVNFLKPTCHCQCSCAISHSLSALFTPPHTCAKRPLMFQLSLKSSTTAHPPVLHNYQSQMPFCKQCCSAGALLLGGRQRKEGVHSLHHPRWPSACAPHGNVMPAPPMALQASKHPVYAEARSGHAQPSRKGCRLRRSEGCHLRMRDSQSLSL